MPFSLAERVGDIRYAIREFVPLARELERKGYRVIYLNIGDPLKYDFDTPRPVKEALYEAVVRGYNFYSASEGDGELREAIAERERRVSGADITADDVVVTQGVSEAINFVMAVSLDPGDEVLLPGPSYPLYPVIARIYGGKPVFYRCLEEEGWSPDVDDVRRKVSERTKALVIINPNNPTGALYSERVLREMLDVAAEHKLLVVSDEIYDQIVYEGARVSVASLVKDVPAVILNGFSKVYLMTGWRLGYLYVVDEAGEVGEALMKAFINMARTRLCASTPVQRAAIAALRVAEEHLPGMLEKLRERRDYIWRRLSEIPGMEAVLPRGAFYIFPRIPKGDWGSDREFTLRLLTEERVLVVHGSGFGQFGEGHVRMVFLPPIEVLEEALDRVERFVKRHAG